MKRIEDYFLLGDLHSAALVSRGGSVDWLCWPEFDSPSLFGALLDEDAGSFSVDTDGYRVESGYVEETAVVEHVFRAGGTRRFTVRDYMVPVERERCRSHFLMRKLTGGEEGAEVTVRFRPRPGYGSRIPHLRTPAGAAEDARIPDRSGSIAFDVGQDTVFLHIPPEARVEDGGRTIRLALEPGEEKALALEYCRKTREPTFAGDDRERATLDFWEAWVGRGDYFDFCRPWLIRSAITLKLSQFYPTGGLVAAPTTSLPADPGGVRNWDYRYVWIRDATFTLYAFRTLGYHEEVNRFFDFLETVAGEGGSLRTLYTIRGEEAPGTSELEHLSGHRGARPVRIGNDATSQPQLDVYGNLIDAHFFMAEQEGRDCEGDRDRLLGFYRAIRDGWTEPDGGIWEAPDRLRHYTYSKVMAWVGVDRLLRLCDDLCLTEDEIREAETVRDEIAGWVWRNCWDEERGTLVEFPGTDAVDATNLFFVLVKFLDKHEERTRDVVAHTCRELCTDDVLVHRYRRDDGLPGRDHAFLLCSIWLISARAILEDVEEAETLFHDFESRMNDALLLPEQIHPETGAYAGNYPQSYSHMGYVMAARYLHKYRSRKRRDGEG